MIYHGTCSLGAVPLLDAGKMRPCVYVAFIFHETFSNKNRCGLYASVVARVVYPLTGRLAD